MQKPIVIISTSLSEIIPGVTSEIRTPRFHVYRAYVDAVKQAGGIPLLVTRPDAADADQIIGLADALLFAGGGDVHPHMYHETPKEYCGSTDEDRDRLEIALLTAALKKQIPILTICKGMQLLNVHFGGTLFQSISIEMPGAIKHDFHELPRSHIAHAVTIIPDTRLARTVGAAQLSVNSFHNQGIKKLGQGLLTSAYTEDGLIEAIELPTHDFVVGVEWHPEELRDEPSRALFSAFIATAQKRTKRPIIL